MTAPDPALTQALDHLAMQVNPDNVLAVHKVFRDHAGELLDYLMKMRGQAQMGLCGGDPISREAAVAFNHKIAELLKVHWAHQQELVVAADHLRSIALSYGITEEEISRSLVAPSHR